MQVGNITLKNISHWTLAANNAVNEEAGRRLTIVCF